MRSWYALCSNYAETELEMKIFNFFSQELAIDLGTANTLIMQGDEIVVEEPIDVETPELEEEAVQEPEGQEEALEEIPEEEPIVLSGGKAKLPVRAISIVAVIVVLIIAFVIISVLKGKKQEGKEEKIDIEAPPDI